MKFFAIFSFIFLFQLFNLTFSLSNFPSPDFSKAKDAIEMPKYKQVLQRMFPHIDYDTLINSRQPKIINGEPSNFGDFPYQVLQYMSTDNVNWYTCGGALIKREWVLTVSNEKLILKFSKKIF